MESTATLSACAPTRIGSITSGPVQLLQGGDRMIEQEAWAEALIMRRTHGEEAGSLLVEQIAALARAGDVAGVMRLRKIADHIDQLASPRP